MFERDRQDHYVLNSEYAEIAKQKGDHYLLHPVKRPPSPEHERCNEYHPLEHESHRREWNVDVNHPLKGLLQQLPQKFFYSGKTKNISKISMNSVTENGTETKLGTIGCPSIAKIVEIAKPSSFGKGSELIYDENIRKGLEIKSGNLTFINCEFDDDSKWRKRKVNRSLIDLIYNDILLKLPNSFLGYKDKDLDDVEVKFYKLAIYETDGHFDKHRDTIHSDKHKATLLIEVKSAHEGGNLILEKNGGLNIWKTSNQSERNSEKAAEFDYSISSDEDERLPEFQLSDEESNSDGKEPKQERDDKETSAKCGSLNWCIFYTDIEHRVEPVKNGVRMVLQFDIYVKELPEEDVNEMDESHENCFYYQ
jgi:hypothetical protein